MKFRSKYGRFIISEDNDVFYVGDDFSKALNVMNSQLPDDELDRESNYLSDDTYKAIPEDESDLFDELCNFNLED